VAIVAVNLLDWFMDVDRSTDNLKLTWAVGILIDFAIAMLLLAMADRLSSSSENKSRQADGAFGRGNSGCHPRNRYRPAALRLGLLALLSCPGVLRVR
jgi:hypothetical protein